MKMKELYMQLLYFMMDKADICGLSLYRGGTYSDIEFRYEDKLYKITLGEEETE